MKGSTTVLYRKEISLYHFSNYLIQINDQGSTEDAVAWAGVAPALPSGGEGSQGGLPYSGHGNLLTRIAEESEAAPHRVLLQNIC